MIFLGELYDGLEWHLKLGLFVVVDKSSIWQKSNSNIFSIIDPDIQPRIHSNTAHFSIIATGDAIFKSRNKTVNFLAIFFFQDSSQRAEEFIIVLEKNFRGEDFRDKLHIHGLILGLGIIRHKQVDEIFFVISVDTELIKVINLRRQVFFNKESGSFFCP